MNLAMIRLMAILRWVLIFAYLQLIFIVGALAGLIVGGIFPSLYACVLVAKELMKTKVDYTATRKFIKIYKRIFWKSNQIGWLATFIAALLMSNIIYFNQLQSTAPWAFAVKMIYFFVMIIVLLTLSLVAPTFIDYQLKIKQLPRLFLTGLGDFRSMIIILGSLIILYFAFLLFTGLLIFVILGLYIFLIALVNRGFETRKLSFDKQNS